MTTTTHRHAAPWTFRQFLADLLAKPSPRRRSPRPGMDHVLTGREATARHLFGETVHWSKLDMLEYDSSPLLRGGWLAEADRRINAARSPERFIAAHHSKTTAEWDALPALVKKDLRESFYQAKGLAS
jgi:hypothetical protein